MTSAAPIPSSPSACDDPVFIVGSPRSGCGTLQWALREHPGLWGAEETDYLADLIEALRRSYRHGRLAGTEQWLGKLDVTWEEFAGSFGIGLNAMHTSRAGGLRWVEQSSTYVHHLADLAVLFPGARYLVMLRDGRAVVDALARSGEQKDPDEACRMWRSATEAGLAWLANAGGQSRQVSYESLVDQPEPTLRGIYDFLGLVPTPASVAYVEGRSPRPPRRRPPSWSGWSRDQRQRFHDAAGDLLITVGYEKDASWLDA